MESLMATYVVATRRECRGRGRTAAEAVARLPGVRVKGTSNPDRVVIESAYDADQIQSGVGPSFYVEREIKHRILRDPP
jgi:hypothetical protein